QHRDQRPVSMGSKPRTRCAVAETRRRFEGLSHGIASGREYQHRGGVAAAHAPQPCRRHWPGARAHLPSPGTTGLPLLAGQERKRCPVTNVLRHVPQSGLAPAQRQSLAFGALGTALLHIVRACTGAEEWDTAHQWVTTVTRGPVAAHTEANLFYGAPAVAFVLRIAAKRSHTTV